MTGTPTPAALRPGRCCLCNLSHIRVGTPIRRMPASWQPDNRNRVAAATCVDELIADLRARVRRHGTKP